jgi:7,8-dihydropterin-6-yl-methyl-4-(beta-D-ribofuranosyl)aminobenzene 5'-phosphate synthase
MPEVAVVTPVDDRRPIAVEPVDEVTITVLVDNTFDTLVPDQGPVRRARPGALTPVPSRLYREGATKVGLRAEHGFSALITVRQGDSRHTLLLDTGISPDGMVVNADALRVDLTEIHAVVLSHGHYDHTGGLLALADRCPGLPLLLHPQAWAQRRIVAPGLPPRQMPTVDRSVLVDAGYHLVENRGPSSLFDGRVLVTGQIDRVTPSSGVCRSTSSTGTATGSRIRGWTTTRRS